MLVLKMGRWIVDDPTTFRMLFHLGKRGGIVVGNMSALKCRYGRDYDSIWNNVSDSSNSARGVGVGTVF